MPRSKLTGSELQFFDTVSGNESTLTKLKTTEQNTLTLEGNTNTDRVRITNVAQPTQASDVATTDYVEGELATLVNDLVVTESQIQDDAVTESKIIDGSITTDKIGALTALTVDGPITATSFITDGDAGGSVSGGSSSVGPSSSIIIRNTDNQLLGTNEWVHTTFDTEIMTVGTDITHDNGLVTLHTTGAYLVTGECVFGISLSTATGAQARMSYIKHSEDSSQRYAHVLTKIENNEHCRWTYSAIIYNTVANSTLSLKVKQETPGDMEFLAGSASINCDMSVVKM